MGVDAGTSFGVGLGYLLEVENPGNSDKNVQFY
jgi:hypothetical protein